MSLPPPSPVIIIIIIVSGGKKNSGWASVLMRLRGRLTLSTACPTRRGREEKEFAKKCLAGLFFRGNGNLVMPRNRGMKFFTSKYSRNYFSVFISLGNGNRGSKQFIGLSLQGEWAADCFNQDEEDHKPRISICNLRGRRMWVGVGGG